MRELHNPTLAPGGFVDSEKIRVALDEVTEISRLRSLAHEQANLFRDLLIAPGSARERQLRGELVQARGVLASWAVMAAHEEFRTVDLARVENEGDWDATIDAEAGIGDVAMDLFMDGQIDGMVEPDTPEAKLRIAVDPRSVSIEGLLVVRRKRLMLATTPLRTEFSDVRSATKRVMVADTSLEIDKVSEFVLDLEGLEEINPRAAAQINAITRDGAAPGEVTNTDGAQAAAALIEAAIQSRHEIIVPAITTYYAERKYRNIRRLEREAEQLAV